MQSVLFTLCVIVQCIPATLTPSSSPPGQPQQALNQMGQPGSTAVSGSTPVQTTAGQRAVGAAPSPRAATPASGQSPAAPVPSSQTNRPQQGQVKLTMAQLMQLTQGAQVRTFVTAVSLPTV